MAAPSSTMAVDATACKTVLIRRAGDGRPQRFRWYGPAPSEECVHRAVRNGLGYETAGVLYGDGSPVVLGGAGEPCAIDLRDERGGERFDAAAVREGAALVARLRPGRGEKERRRGWPLFAALLRDLRRSVRGESGAGDWYETGVVAPDFDASPARGDWNDPRFQRTLLGVERIRSHLANERNILAWTRAAFTMASQGLLVWKLFAAARASDSDHWLAPYLYWTALGYFLVVPTTMILGLHRWQTTKEALNVAGGLDVQRYFGKLGVRVQAANIFLICLMAAACFVVVGLDDGVFSDFRIADW